MKTKLTLVFLTTLLLLASMVSSVSAQDVIENRIYSVSNPAALCQVNSEGDIVVLKNETDATITGQTVSTDGLPFSAYSQSWDGEELGVLEFWKESEETPSDVAGEPDVQSISGGIGKGTVVVIRFNSDATAESIAGEGACRFNEGQVVFAVNFSDGSSVNLRISPSLSADATSLPSGTSVTIIGFSDDCDFAEVILNKGTTGFLHSTVLSGTNSNGNGNDGNGNGSNGTPQATLFQNPITPGREIFVPCNHDIIASLWDGVSDFEVVYRLSGNSCSDGTGQLYNLRDGVTGSAWIYDYADGWTLNEIDTEIDAHIARSNGVARRPVDSDYGHYFE